MASNNKNYSQSMISALDAFNEDFQRVDANNGGRQRPPNGQWVNILKSIEVEQSEDTTIRVADKVEVPGFLVKFEYMVMGGTYPIPPEFKQGQVWPGRSFALPSCSLKNLPAGVSKGKIQNLEINASRLKGHLQAILGDKFSGNLGADLMAATALVESGEAVVVRVACQWQENDKDPAKPYFEEKIMRREA